MFSRDFLLKGMAEEEEVVGTRLTCNMRFSIPTFLLEAWNAQTNVGLN